MSTSPFAALPVSLDFEPMEARSVAALPDEAGWQFEPKWDGFRCLAFRDGDDVDLRAKSGKPLARYFPEMVAFLRSLPVQRFVLDGPAGQSIARGSAIHTGFEKWWSVTSGRMPIARIASSCAR